jgi:DNA-binding transcriptional LysR family regulator
MINVIKEGENMPIRYMKIFIRVYQMESVTKAAESLNMAQPAVTRIIQEIEKHYGIQLFERYNKHLYVTEAGRKFYMQALHIVDAYDAMEASLLHWEWAGVLRIGASITIGNYLLPKFIRHFQKENPELQIEVNVSSGGILQKKLQDGELDMALIEGNVQDDTLYAEPFQRDELVLIVPNGHPLSEKKKVQLKDIQNYPLLMREKGSMGRDFLDSYFEVNDMSIRPVWESTSTQALIRAVICELGISILPGQLVEEWVQRKEITQVEISDADFSRQNYIVWHRKKRVTESMQKFIDLCKANDNMREIR